ncbi:MAG: phosphoenolpyruvate synthase [Deltaproteobacteria bacterium]|nr:MAG: phosphoenolpyruvate synthase [Deltaproteobacteria bacterium]
MTAKSEAEIIWLEELRKEDVPIVGGKNANLGELHGAIGAPVPPGFAITGEMYRRFMADARLDQKASEILKDLDSSNLGNLLKASEELRAMIEKTPMPEQVISQILEAYDELGRRCGKPDVLVAVRSSATAEDLPDASFAGQQDTFLNVGREELADRVRACWSSLFTSRAISYREEKGFRHEDVLLSVAVMEMVQARSSGVTFTIEPVTGETNKVIINSAWGLGEAVVSGRVTPDEYAIGKDSLEILERHVAVKKEMCVRRPEGDTTYVEVPEDLQSVPALNDDEIIRITEEAKNIESHYGGPQDIEWAIDEDGKLYILQARPETVHAQEKPMDTAAEQQVGDGEVILKGLGVSPGLGSGPVNVVKDVKEIQRVKQGDILVTEMTTPDWVPVMKISSAIVTNSGGKTCHAAIVSRELGIPCVVGTNNATEVLIDVPEVSVEGSTGVIYRGIITREEEAPQVAVGAAAPEPTATKVYVNISIPEIAHKVAAETQADGVGLLRAEHMMLSVGKHPRLLLEEGGAEIMVEKFTEGIKAVAEAFYPRPVVYRFLDFKPDEFLEMPGGEEYERENVGPNPMIGYRGQHRYMREDDIFRLELRSIRSVRETYGLNNVWVMLPFVRTLWVFREAVRIMREEGLDHRADPDFQLWIMVEVPSSVFLIEEFCLEGIDGISFGTNDLTMLILGVDRNDAKVQELYDERDLSVLRAIAYCITICRQHGVTTSICGQAPSVYPDYLEFLLRCGSTSISVLPDSVVSARKMVASLERKVQMEQMVEGTIRPRVAKFAMDDIFFWRKVEQ